MTSNPLNQAHCSLSRHHSLPFLSFDENNKRTSSFESFLEGWGLLSYVTEKVKVMENDY